jgi:hypothetical protein
VPRTTQRKQPTRLLPPHADIIARADLDPAGDISQVLTGDPSTHDDRGKDDLHIVLLDINGQRIELRNTNAEQLALDGRKRLAQKGGTIVQTDVPLHT